MYKCKIIKRIIITILCLGLVGAIVVPEGDGFVMMETQAASWSAKTMNCTVQGKEKKIVIKWNKLSGAEKYRIQRREKGGSWKTLDTVASEKIKYIDSSAKSGKTYFYKVTATNGKKWTKGKESKAVSRVLKTGKREVKLVDSGYTVTRSGNYCTISYAVEIYNSSGNYAIEFPTIHITARSSDGKILKTEDMMLFEIAAGDQYKYANYISYEGADPASVEISVSNDNNDYNYTLQKGSDIIYSSDLLIKNTSERVGSYKKTYTGEVVNKSNCNIDMAAISVIYKLDEKIIGGTTSYVDDLRKGKTKAFEVDDFSNIAGYDSYEIYALAW